MRPRKIRIIDAVPGWQRYLPEGRPNAAEIVVGLDMFEAMRLVDAEGLPQDVAARSMGISTPTLCRLLGEARRRIATALRDGWALRCDGGNVMVRPCGQPWAGGPHGHRCHRRSQDGPESAAVAGLDATLAVEHGHTQAPCATEMQTTDDQSIRDGGPATVVAEGTARDVRKPIRGKECETAVMSGRTYNDGQNGFRAVGSCEQEPAERRRPGMRRGPWRPRRQKTRPQPEGSSPGRGFCRFAGQRPGCTGARLEVASRPEFAPPIPSDNQIIDVRAVGVPAVKEDSVDARRGAALKALMRHIASFTDGRVRLRHEAFKEQAIHAALRQPLELTGQFTALEFKAATGSVLLRYDAGRLSRDDFLEAAVVLGLFLATC